MFNNAKSIEIGGKVVKSIMTENGGVLYQKDNPLTFDVTISDNKNFYITSMFRGNNMTIDYGDGIIRPMTDDTINWTYEESGTYTIKIYGVETIFIDLENIPIISNVSIPDYVTVAPPLFTYNNTQYAGWWSSSKNITIDNLANGTKISHTPAEFKYWTPNKPNTSLPLPKFNFNLMVDWNDFICEFTYIESEGDIIIELRDINGNKVTIPFNELSISQGDVIKIMYTNDILTLYINDVPQEFNNISDTSACSGDVNIRLGIKAGYIIYDDFKIIDTPNYSLRVTTNEPIIQIEEETTITAKLINYNLPVSGETVIFSGALFSINTIADNSYSITGDEYSIRNIPNMKNHIQFIIGDINGNRIYMNNNSLVIKKGSSELIGGVDLNHEIWVNNSTLTYINEQGTEQIYDFSEYNIDIHKFSAVTSLTLDVYQLSLVTDSNGECSVGYVGKGAGDLNIKVEVPDCSLVSEIYVEDCIFYSTDEIVSNASDNYKILSSLPSLPSQFILSFDYKTNAEARIGLFSSNNFSGNPNYSVFIGSPNGVRWYYGERTTSTHTTDITDSSTSYYNYSIRRDKNMFYYQRNGTGDYSRNLTWFDNYSYVLGMMGWYGSNSATAKNIKLKPL